MQSVTFNPNTGSFDEGMTTTVQSPKATPIVQDTGLSFSITPGSGEGLKVSKVTTINQSDLQFSNEGVLATATNYGSPVRHSSDVRDTTLVMVGGVEMTAKSAASMGFLVRLPDGSYSEAKEGELVADSSQDDHHPQEEDPYNPDLTSKELESTLDAAARDLGGYEALDRQALSAISGLAKGDLTGAVKSLVSSANTTPEEAESFITEMYEGFRSKAANYIQQKHGVNGEEVFEWAADNLADPEKASIFHMVYLGRSKALDGLVTKYLKFGRKNA